MKKKFRKLPQRRKRSRSPFANGHYVSAGFWLPPKHNFKVLLWPDEVPILDKEEVKVVWPRRPLKVLRKHPALLLFAKLARKHFLDPSAATIVLILLESRWAAGIAIFGYGTLSLEHIWNDVMANLGYVVISDREDPRKLPNARKVGG